MGCGGTGDAAWAATLEALALAKGQEIARRPDIVAVAITGSIARGTVWEGSDIDLWAFAEGPEAFEDGLMAGVYWEVDIRPASCLELPVSDERWLRPPRAGERADGLFEALWGCRVVHDPSSALARLKAAIDGRVADRRWLDRRAALYLAYGRGYLDALRQAEPLSAIAGAREVATDYGLAAYWMRQGRLLTSACRIPEQLMEAPRLHELYCRVFGLYGREGAEELLRGLQELPSQVQRRVQRDLELEVLPVLAHGCYDGGVRYLRQGMARWFRPEEVAPVLGLEADLAAQKERVLAEVGEILALCEGV